MDTNEHQPAQLEGKSKGTKAKGNKKTNSKSKKNQKSRNAAKKLPVNSGGDSLFDKVYQTMEKHKEVRPSCLRLHH